MKKLMKWSIIMGSSVAALAATISPVVISHLNNQPHIKSVFPGDPGSQINFDDNLNKYTSLAKQSALVDFQKDDISLLPYEAFPVDANNHIYQSVFNRIDSSVVENDFYHFLKGMVEDANNDLFKFKIKDVQFKQVRSVDAPVYQITLKFDIHNANYRSLNLSISNDPSSVQEVNFLKQEVKPSTLVIESPVHPFFYEAKLGNGLSNLYASYFFDNAQWTVGDETLQFNQFFLNLFSPTLNTVVKNVESAKGYLDYKTIGHQALQGLNINHFVSDVKREFNAQWERTINLIGPAQRILQEIVKNQPILTTLNNISDDAKLVVDGASLATDVNLDGVGVVLQKILKNPSVYQLINDKTFTDNLIKVIGNVAPHLKDAVAPMLETLVGGTEEEFKAKLTELLNSDMVNQIIPPIFVEKILAMLDEPILTFISKNIPFFIDLLKPLLSSEAGFLNDVVNLLESLKSFDFTNKTLLDLVVTTIQAKDTTQQSIVRKLLSLVLDENTLTTLDSLIFNNKNINAKNLATGLSCLANPVDEQGKVVSLEDWANSLTIEHHPIQQAYNSTTRQLDLEYQVKYIIGKKLIFKVKNLWPLLPANLQMASTMFPDDIQFFANDYFSVKYLINDQVDYDIVPNSQGTYNLSWKAVIDKQIDLHFPYSIKNIYSQYSFITRPTLNQIMPVVSHFFYGTYSNKMIYRPISSPSLSEIEITDYNPNKKTDEQVLANQLSPELVKQITDKVSPSIKFTSDPSTKFEYYKRTYAYKTGTTIDVSLFDEFLPQMLDTSILKHKDDLKVFINSNIIVPKGYGINLGLTSINIPHVIKTSVTFALPYNVYSNDGQFTNSWTFNF